MDLAKAKSFYSGLKWSLLAWAVSCLLLLYVGATGALAGYTFRPVVFMLPGLLYVLATGLTVLLGNALGRFGLKYALPPLVLPLAGLAFAILRVRDHLLRAQLAQSGQPAPKSLPVPEE